MIGRRVYTDETGHLLLKEGDYGKDKDGLWFARPPGCHTGCLSNHQVIEHEDGTITVSPSIRVADWRTEWHGYLVHGEWTEVK
jgi:hypothetical protein